MGSNLDISYVFRYPFEAVVKVYFFKYKSGKDQNVDGSSIQIIERSMESSTRIEYIKRQCKCKNVLPSILRPFFSEPCVMIEEEIWLDHRSRRLTTHSYNMTFTSLARLEEWSIFQADKNNENWTKFEQHGQITCFGLGYTLGTVAENFGISFLQCGAKKGRGIMEELLAGYKDQKELNVPAYHIPR